MNRFIPTALCSTLLFACSSAEPTTTADTNVSSPDLLPDVDPVEPAGSADVELGAIFELSIPLPSGTTDEVFLTFGREVDACFPVTTAPGFLMDDLRAE